MNSQVLWPVHVKHLNHLTLFLRCAQQNIRIASPRKLALCAAFGTDGDTAVVCAWRLSLSQEWTHMNPSLSIWFGFGSLHMRIVYLVFGLSSDS